MIPALHATLDRLLTSACQHTPLPGAIFGLWLNDTAIFQQAYGSYQPTSPVPLASGAKWLTAATVLRLVDENLLELDAPLAACLPHWPRPAADATLRQLLSHTAGFPSSMEGRYRTYPTLQACAEDHARRGLLAAPGTLFQYGNIAFQVAGALAETVTGQSWHEVFATRVARPLGLVHTHYHDTPNPHLGGGAVSTLADYGLFLQQLLPTARPGLLSPALRQAMLSDQTGDTPTSSLHPDQRRYGLGCWLDAVTPAGDPWRFSSEGIWGCFPWLDRQRNLCAVLLTENELPRVLPVVRRLQRHIERALP